MFKFKPHNAYALLTAITLASSSAYAIPRDSAEETAPSSAKVTSLPREDFACSPKGHSAVLLTDITALVDTNARQVHTVTEIQYKEPDKVSFRVERSDGKIREYSSFRYTEDANGLVTGTLVRQDEDGRTYRLGTPDYTSAEGRETPAANILAATKRLRALVNSGACNR